MNPVLTANLRALKTTRPAVAAAIASAEPSRILRPVTTRDGLRGLSMVIDEAETDAEQRGGTGEKRSSVERALHSRYDPRREATRVAASALPHPVETVVIFGIEAGFLARHVVEHYRSATVIVVERSWGVIRTALEWIDLSSELGGGRLHLAITAADLVQLLDEVHLPLLGDRAATITVPPWVEARGNRQHFRACARALEEKIRIEQADAGTIRRFGRRWLAHTLLNTRRMNNTRDHTRSHTPAVERLEAVVRGRPVTVLAAGPGLDRHLERTIDGGTVDTIFAVDTALPALIQRGIAPAAVVTLDPQSWSTLHFRKTLPRGTILLSDVGAPPQVIRDIPPEQLVWYFGRHPLHQLLYLAGAPLFKLPAPVESVTEAAVVIARGLGAASVKVHGADGGFPRGKTYARGTYHYTLALRAATRIAPVEHFFAYRTYPGTNQYENSDGPFFSTPDMSTRARSLENLVESSEAPALGYPRKDDFFDSNRFWSDHLEQLQVLLEKLATRRAAIPPQDPALSTNELMKILGPHGIAHLPVIARFGHENRSQTDEDGMLSPDEDRMLSPDGMLSPDKDGMLSPDRRLNLIHTTVKAVQGFISSENRRYC